MSKITLKDYIGWIIALVLGIAAIIFRTENDQLKHKQEQTYNQARILQQNNYFINAPQDTKAILDTIITNTAPSSSLKIEK